MDLKLGVWDGFVLPSLGALAGSEVERRLSAVYHDTPDLRLLRHGVMARVSDGEWTVHWAGRTVTGADGPALTRGWALGAPLAPVATLDTLRRTLTLEGAVLHQDDVSVVRAERVAARFHELEISGASEPRLEALRAQLAGAGAQPVDPAPKLVRALGPAAVVPWPLEVEPPGAGASTAEVIRFRLMRNVAALADEHAAVLLDGTVRRARSAVRGLRRDLRLFAPLLDAAPPPLKPLADALARVRRLDHVIERAPDALAELLRVERGAALDTLQAMLRDEHFGELLVELAAFVTVPPTVKSARRPASELLPRLIREPLSSLHDVSGRDPEALRKPAVRLSVALEAALPYAGRDARRAAARLDELTDALRDHHRAELAIGALRELAGSDAAFAAGLLAGLETARAAQARARVAAVRPEALRRRHWSWVPR